MVNYTEDSEPTEMWKALTPWASVIAKAAYEAYTEAKVALGIIHHVAGEVKFMDWVEDLARGLVVWAKYVMVFAVAPAVQAGILKVCMPHYIAMCCSLCVLGCSNGKFSGADKRNVSIRTQLSQLELWHPLALPAVVPWHNGVLDALHAAILKFECEELVPCGVFSLPGIQLDKKVEGGDFGRADFHVTIMSIVEFIKTVPKLTIRCPFEVRGHE